VDQNFCSGLTHLCAQGVLYIWPSTDKNASTTAVWPGSHRETYNRLMRDPFSIRKGRKKLNSQSVQINQLHDVHERESLAMQAIAGTRRVPCPAGSLLLWDSRTIHQGWAAGPRMAQPVCYEPRSRRDEAALLRKLFMCATGTPSSHSSSEGRVHAMAKPGKPCPKAGSDYTPALALSPPYCVMPSCSASWHVMQDELWGPNDSRQDPEKNSKKFTEAQGEAVKAILRPEVLDVL